MVKIKGARYGNPFVKGRKGKTWVSPNEAFEKTVKQTRKARKDVMDFTSF